MIEIIVNPSHTAVVIYRDGKFTKGVRGSTTYCEETAERWAEKYKVQIKYETKF